MALWWRSSANSAHRLRRRANCAKTSSWRKSISLRSYRAGLREVVYRPLPKYPAVDRDFSFVFDNSVIFEDISLGQSRISNSLNFAASSR